MTSTVGGPSRRTGIGRALPWIEFGVLALLLASCGDGGGDDPNRLRTEPDAGDERPIELRVGIRVTAGSATVEPRRIAAFLPVRFVMTSSVRGLVGIPRVGVSRVRPGRRSSIFSAGLEPGRIRIEVPSGHETLVVRPGG